MERFEAPLAVSNVLRQLFKVWKAGPAACQNCSARMRAAKTSPVQSAARALVDPPAAVGVRDPQVFLRHAHR